MQSPMTKATLASAVLSSASNIIAQILEAYRDKRPFAFDIAIFLRFVTVTVVTAPPNYMWQQFLERKFPAYEHRWSSHGSDSPRGIREKQINRDPEAGTGPEPARKLNIRNTFAKWFLDCITLGAIFNTIAFFFLMGILKAQPVATIAHNIRTETIPLIVAGYKIWPFASVVSFSWVPVDRRIVFLNFVGLLWGIYMSLIAVRV